MVLFCFSTWAQVETALKLDEEGVETNPLEVPEAAADVGAAYRFQSRRPLLHLALPAWPNRDQSD